MASTADEKTKLNSHDRVRTALAVLSLVVQEATRKGIFTRIAQELDVALAEAAAALSEGGLAHELTLGQGLSVSGDEASIKFIVSMQQDVRLAVRQRSDAEERAERLAIRLGEVQAQLKATEHGANYAEAKKHELQLAFEAGARNMARIQGYLDRMLEPERQNLPAGKRLGPELEKDPRNHVSPSMMMEKFRIDGNGHYVND